MSQRPARPEGMPWLSPYLTVKDSDAALEFYRRAFGFETRHAVPGPDGRTMHAEVTWRDAVIMLGPEGSCDTRSPATSGTPSPVQLYVYCDDVDALFARATEAGARPSYPPRDMFWGDRMCQLIDPDGHSWNFATHLGGGVPSEAA